jgi:signal transduction histidine kinase
MAMGRWRSKDERMMRWTLRVSQGELVFLLVVVVVYATMLLSAPQLFSLPQALPLFVCGVLYTILGVAGFSNLDEVSSPLLLGGYFVTQILLGSIVTYLANGAGAAWLLLMPIVGQSVLLPRRWMLLVAASLVVLFGLGFAVDAGWRAAAEASVSYAAGVVFVIVITKIALREERARAEVEQLASKLQRANQQLTAYAAQVEQLATLEERNRVAREIHDSLGHYLTTIHVQIAAARAVFDHDRSRADDALHKAQTLAHEGLNEVRRSVAALRAVPTNSRSLNEAITTLVAETRTTDLEATLEVQGDPRPLNPLAELTCYRAVQEGLTNIHRHACARNARVVLDYGQADVVRLRICDDGVGSAGHSNGFGLRGIQERVQQLGGVVRLHTGAGQGFTLELEVPA